MKPLYAKKSSVDIDSLVDKLHSAVESKKNQSRLHQPQIRFDFSIEDPIAWVKIFGYNIHEYFNNPTFYFEQNLRQKLWRWENFPDDPSPITLEVPAWLGHYPEYTYAGMNLSFTPEGAPVLQTDHPLTQKPDLSLLKPVDFFTSGWMPRALKWHEDLCKIAKDRVKITFNMMWWRGCLDLAIQLRGYENFLVDTVEQPAFVHNLMKWLVEQRCRWHEAYFKYFGIKKEPANIGDDWINIPYISPEIFEDFVLPYYLEIEAFHGSVVHIHSCGNQTPIQKQLLKIQSLPRLEVSPWTDLSQSLVNIPPTKELYINLHPNDILCASPQQIEQQIRNIITLCTSRKFQIATSGLTPLSDNIDEFIETILTWIATMRKCMIAKN